VKNYQCAVIILVAEQNSDINQNGKTIRFVQDKLLNAEMIPYRTSREKS
jgi:hypothetical protein